MSKALNYEPGAEFSYTNTGYNLLAVIMERVTGESFAELTRQQIFESLGMKHTSWRDDFTRIVKGRAIAYIKAEDGFHSEMPFENVHGNGGLLTTSEDLLLWNENFTHGKVGGPALIEALQRRGRLNDNREIEYAGGLFMLTYEGLPEVSQWRRHRGLPGVSLEVSWPGPLRGRPLQPGRYQSGRARPSRRGPLPEGKESRGSRALLGFPTPHGRDRLQGRYLPQQPHGGRAPAGDEGGQDAHGRRARRLAALPLAVPGGEWLEARLQSQRPRVLTADGDVIPFDRMAEVAPTAAQFAEYVGDYTSDEAEVTWKVAVEEGKLVLKWRPDTVVAMKPIYADAFHTENGFLIRFFRKEGKVSELSLGLTRVRDLRFARR